MPLARIAEEEELFKEGQIVNVGGIIVNLSEKITKKGDSMAIFRLEDRTGHIDIVVFPRDYAKYRKFLHEEAPIELEGRFATDDRGNKIMASAIAPLEKHRPPTLLGRPRYNGNRFNNNGYRNYKKY